MPVTKIATFNINQIGLELKRAKRTLPVRIGNLAVNHFKSGFRKGGGQTDNSRGGWKPRKRNRDRGRAILVKSGNLRNDIRRRETSFRRIIVGTKRIDYSGYHNEGTNTLPQREHIGHSSEMNRKIERLIKKTLDKAFK